MRQPLGPLDGEHAVGRPGFLEPEVVGGGSLEPIEVRVIEGQPSSAVFVNEGEGGAADFVWIDAQAGGQASRERRLAGAERPCQEDDVAGLQPRGEVAGDLLRLLFGMTVQLSFSRPVS